MSTNDSKLTQSDLKRLLDYNPETGAFTWKLVDNNRLRPGDVAGSIRKSGYINLGVQGALYLAHRLAWLYVNGQWPAGELDHINRDRSDNRIVNLREVTREQNCQNMLKPSNNTSGYKGVTFDRRKNMWMAKIYTRKRSRFLGYWHRAEDAGAAYAAAAAKIHTHNPSASTLAE